MPLSPWLRHLIFRQPPAIDEMLQQRIEARDLLTWAVELQFGPDPSDERPLTSLDDDK